MRLGILDRRITLEEMLTKRLFPSRVDQPQPWEEYYWGRVTTREIPRCTRHTLKYAA